VIGRDEEIKRVMQILTRRTKNNPVIIGEAGVGKTELAKALTQFLFDDEDAMIRIDMSEFMEKHTVSRLIGAPPGYVGYEEAGQLTEAVRRRPFRVILFDEVEKAHPDVLKILLQILEDGRLTDGHGRTVDFKNTVVIMTSNLGTEMFKRQAIGFSSQEEDEQQKLKSDIEKELKQAFRPEFLNRIDNTVIFQPLTEEHLKKIVDLLISEVQTRLADRNIKLEMDDEAKAWLLKEGYEPAFGARPLRRAIQRHVENPLSSQILKGEIKDGETVVVGVSGDVLSFNTKKKVKAAK
jgi:ATP-dependent Clp protease ATP-binding subunit ClpC